MSEYTSDGMSDRMPEYICQIECQNTYQIECQIECQNVCQIECQDNVRIYVSQTAMVGITRSKSNLFTTAPIKFPHNPRKIIRQIPISHFLHQPPLYHFKITKKSHRIPIHSRNNPAFQTPDVHGYTSPKDRSQMLHAWNIYLHVGTYSSTMKHRGMNIDFNVREWIYHP